MIEDFELHDILLSDSFPKEINKGKIKDIFEILQTQERPDLSHELKKLLLLKTIEKDTSKIEVINTMDLALINRVLPTEMLKKILENLDYKSLCSAKQTFKRWKDIIDEFKLVEQALGKFLEFCFVHLSKKIFLFDFNHIYL